MNRRQFLTGFAASLGLLVTPEPIRRYWAVPRNAPLQVYEHAPVSYMNPAGIRKIAEDMEKRLFHGQINEDQFDGLDALIRNDYGRPTDMVVPNKVWRDLAGVEHITLNETRGSLDLPLVGGPVGDIVLDPGWIQKRFG